MDSKEDGDPAELTTEVCVNSTFKCGNCIACFRLTDCEKCPNCINKISPCLRRVCVQAGLISNEPATSQTSSSESSTKKDSSEQKKKIKKKEVCRKICFLITFLAQKQWSQEDEITRKGEICTKTTRNN